MNDSASRNYVLISTDAHAGADIQGYKPYLPVALYDELDAWAAEFHDPWADLGLATHPPKGHHLAAHNQPPRAEPLSVSRL